MQENAAFQTFQDWIQLAEHRRQDWISVLHDTPFQVDQRENLFTWSVLWKPDESKEHILNRYEWDVHLLPKFGIPHFYQMQEVGADPKTFFTLDEEQVRSGKVYPFVLLRTFSGLYPDKWEIVQNYVLYHNLYVAIEEERQTIWRRLDHDGNEHDVIRERHQGRRLEIEVRVHELRDYLAARGVYLVRYHDHRRNFQRISDNKDTILDWKEEDLHYHLSSQAQTRSELASSWLLGKDLISPYERPVLYWPWDEHNGRSEDFIIGVDESGRDIVANARGGYLDFLTPVYFRKEVLQRYYSEPTKYTVTADYLRCLDLWGLDIDANSEGLIYAWIGDLGRIPVSEQRHWRAFNVRPAGGITTHRFLRDFEARFVDYPDPIGELSKVIQAIQSSSMRILGNHLLLPLEQADAHVARALHVPLSEEMLEFEQQIQLLAKLTVDSLNVSLLESLAPKEKRQGVTGSINLLEITLAATRVDREEIKATVRPLRILQRLRSSIAAHRKGTEFQQVDRELGLSQGTSLPTIFQRLVEGMTFSMQALLNWVASQDSGATSG